MNITTNIFEKIKKYDERMEKGLLSLSAKLFFVFLVAAVIVSVNLSPAFASDATTITTDKTKYSLGDTITITGAGFTPGNPVTITVLQPDKVIDTLPTVMADASGGFVTTYSPPQISGRYKIIATDGTNTASTAATEADVNPDFRQCAELGPPLGNCNWINSILQPSNSKYFEGMSTPQQLLLAGVDTSSNNHSLQFRVMATKGGLHAYDFITSQTQAVAAANTIGGITLTPDNCGPQMNPKVATTCNKLLSGPFVDVPVPGDPFISKDGATQDKINAYENIFGPRTIRLYGSGISNAVLTEYGHTDGPSSMTLVPSGGDTTDTYIVYNLQWRSNSADYLVLFDGHIAVGGLSTSGVQWGPGLGEAQISGGSYHFKMDQIVTGSVTESLGSLDNQLMGSAVFIPPTTPIVTTQVRNATNSDITGSTVLIGTIVHDHATVDTGSATVTIPTGSTFTFHRYTTIDCSGTPTDQSGVAVPSGAQNGSADSNTFTPGDGNYSYKVDFISGNNDSVTNTTGVCEPFTVTGVPNTTINISSSAATIENGSNVTLTVTEQNTGTVPLTNLSVVLTGGLSATLTAPPTSGDMNSNGILDVGETWTWILSSGTLTSNTTFTATGHGLDPLSNDITYPTYVNEQNAISVTVIHPATTLTTKSVTPGTTVETGTQVTITVTEANTGDATLTGVSVTGTGCTTWTGSASTLAAGASTDFSCTFTPSSTTNWTADGYGKDLLNNDVPATGEHTSGTVTVIHPATNLTLKSQTPANPVESGTQVTIVVTETNTGDDALTVVSVTGTGCTSWTGGNSTLAVGASTNFTCTYSPTVTSPWSATGHGKDSLNNDVPATGETVEGSVTVIHPATMLTTKSVTPGTTVEIGTQVTITVNETNTGDANLTDVSVTGTGCTTWIGGASTLAIGASTDFTCNFTPSSTTNWTADGHGKDPLNNDVPATAEHVSGTVTVVDANISLSPLTATNNIGSPHTIIATVKQNLGDGAGFVNAPDGTLVTFSLLNNTAGATFVSGNTCTTVGGTCSVQINSSTPGSVDIHGTTTFSVGGVNLTRATGDGLSGDSANASKIYVAGSLVVTKALDLGSYPFTVNTSFNITVKGPSYPSGTNLTFHVVNGALTDSPKTLNNLIPGLYNVTEIDPGIAWVATGGGGVTVNPDATNTSSVTNTLKQPHTTISITPNVFETLPGENVILTITDKNDGAVPLTNPYVNLTYDSTTVTLNKTSYYVSGDTNNNDIMDPGETWTWSYTVLISNTTTFSVAGHGLDPLGNDISPANGYTTEAATVTVRTIGATRTLGFWQTHTNFTSFVFGTYFGGGMPIGTAPHKGLITNTLLPGQSQLFGGFYAPIAKTTTGVKRSQIDQARIQLLQQLIAAKLNCAAFGCSETIQGQIANADSVYATGTKDQILAAASQMDAYNNGGDDIAIPTSLPSTGKATPDKSQSYANVIFWNSP